MFYWGELNNERVSLKASTFTELQTRSEFEEARELIAGKAVKVTLHLF